MRSICYFLLFSALALPTSASAQESGKAVLDVLASNCLSCHEGPKAKAGLDLSRIDKILRGSDSGAVVVPGNASVSPLVAATLPKAKGHMPPKGQLDKDEIDILKKWVSELPATTAVGRQINAADRDHWAFRPVRRPEPPKVKNGAWVRSPIDAFILAKLEGKGLFPAPMAERRDLIRRASFDLIGLPPTPEEVDAFVGDKSPGAYEALLDRLLRSPQYGERWGRHWLDLARYAESNGIGEDGPRPSAWRYRDYVIKAFNEDKPYARFLTEQIAGDELAPTDLDAVTATGFCRHAPTVDAIRGPDGPKYRLEELDDVISTASQVFLGLTIGCARCHDHKTDPLLQADYYRMLAIFNSSAHFSAPVDKAPVEKGKKTESIMAITDSSPKHKETRLLIRGNLNTPGGKVDPGVPVVLSTVPFPPLKTMPKTTGLRSAFAEWLTAKDNPLTYRVIVNRIWQYHFGRGIVPTSNNFGKSGDPPSHPELLDWLASEFIERGGSIKAMHKTIMMSSAYMQSSRLDAKAHLIDPEAIDLWRMPKRRLEAEPIRDSILTIAGTLNPKMGGPSIMPRINPGIVAGAKAKWPNPAADGPEQWRRSVYIFVKRGLPVPMMELMDLPSSSQSCERRSESIVATQALMFLNGEFIGDQARRFAKRVQTEAGAMPEQQIERAFRLALQRGPDAEEVRQLLAFLTAQSARYRSTTKTQADADFRALADLCQALFASNEFVFLN